MQYNWLYAAYIYLCFVHWLYSAIKLTLPILLRFFLQTTHYLGCSLVSSVVMTTACCIYSYEPILHRQIFFWIWHTYVDIVNCVIVILLIAAPILRNAFFTFKWVIKIFRTVHKDAQSLTELMHLHFLFIFMFIFHVLLYSLYFLWDQRPSLKAN